MRPSQESQVGNASLVSRAVRGARAHTTEHGLADLVLALHDACAEDDAMFRSVIKALDRFPDAVARMALVSDTIGEHALSCIAGSPTGQHGDDDAARTATKGTSGEEYSVRSIRIRASTSVAAFRTFLDENRLSELAVALAVRIDRVSDGPVEGDIEVRSQSPRVGWFVWDRFPFNSESLAGVALALHAVAHEITCTIRPRPTIFSPGPLYAFHPERFKDSRHYAHRARHFHGSGGLPTFEAIQSVMDLVGREMHDRLCEFTRREKLARPTHATVLLEAEEELAMAWLKYVGAGKQLFHIPPHMSDMLRSTDADDVPVAMIRAPYLALFLHFGSQADLELAPGWFIDGCYVEHHPEVPLLSFMFTARPTDPTRMAEWHSFGEPVEVVHLANEAFSYDLATAVDQAVAERVNRLREELAKGDEDITVEIKAAADDHVLPDGMRVERVSGSRAEHQLAVLEQRRHTVHGALQLAVNALCYLTAYPDDVEEAWPEGTPEALRRTAEEGPPNKRKRAAQELARLGYSRIKVCGGALQRGQAPQAAIGGLDGSHTVRTHWRRGHWRRQAHGEGRVLRKLIWLMPTLVNPGGGDGDDIGHIYTVG